MMQRKRKRKRLRPVYAFVPVDFDIKKCVRPEYYRYEDCVKWLISTIYFRRLMLFTHDTRKAGRPVNLKRKYLERILPCRKHLTHILSDLQSSHAVLCDKKYMRGKKSYGYSLGPLFSTKFRRSTVTNWFLCRNLRQWRRTEITELTDLQKWLRDHLEQIKIDAQAALKGIVADTDEKHNLVENQILTIDQNQIFFHPDKYGRIHTNLTNLQTDIRNYLRVGESTLAEIDIANSQPLFLSLLLRRNIYHPHKYLHTTTLKTARKTDNKTARKTANKTKSIIKSVIKSITKPSPPHSTPLRSTFSKDMRMFITDCQNGLIYERIANRAKRTIKQVKHRVLRVLYCNHRLWDGRRGIALREADPEQARVFRVMDRLYPSVMKFVRRSKDSDYRHLSQRMQRMESYFVFNCVCERIRREYPEMWIATIHDSILCRAEEVEVVRCIMQDEFFKLNASAVLRVKHYTLRT